MPFIPVPDTIMVELLYDYNGQVVENVFNVHKATAWDSTTMLACLQSFRDWYNTSMKPSVPANVILSTIKGTDLTTQTGPVVFQPTGLPITGTPASANPMPNNVTVAVKWNTALRGRSFRGRTYHVGLQAGMVTGNTIAAGTRTALQNAYTALITAILPSNAKLVVVSRRSNNDWRVTGITTDIVGCSIDNNIDSQRNRLAGRGT